MKFTIRDILWLTILVAVSVAWWLDHRTSLRMQEQLRQQAEQLQYQSHIELAQRLLAETEVATGRRAVEAQARDAALEVKAAMEKLAKPSP